MASILRLPNEILLEIFANLDFPSLERLSAVCQRFRDTSHFISHKEQIPHLRHLVDRGTLSLSETFDSGFQWSTVSPIGALKLVITHDMMLWSMKSIHTLLINVPSIDTVDVAFRRVELSDEAALNAGGADPRWTSLLSEVFQLLIKKTEGSMTIQNTHSDLPAYMNVIPSTYLVKMAMSSTQRVSWSSVPGLAQIMLVARNRPLPLNPPPSKIKSLFLEDLKLSEADWSCILPGLSFPQLTNISIGYSAGISDMHAFLRRHPTIETLKLSKCSVTGRVQLTPYSFLPHVKALTVYAGSHIEQFLTLAGTPFPSLTSITWISERTSPYDREVTRYIEYDFSQIEPMLQALAARKGYSLRLTLSLLSQAGFAEWLKSIGEKLKTGVLKKTGNVVELNVRFEKLLHVKTLGDLTPLSELFPDLQSMKVQYMMFPHLVGSC